MFHALLLFLMTGIDPFLLFCYYTIVVVCRRGVGVGVELVLL
jgi:hypothetical protein